MVVLKSTSDIVSIKREQDSFEVRRVKGFDGPEVIKLSISDKLLHAWSVLGEGKDTKLISRGEHFNPLENYEFRVHTGIEEKVVSATLDMLKAWADVQLEMNG